MSLKAIIFGLCLHLQAQAFCIEDNSDLLESGAESYLHESILVTSLLGLACFTWASGSLLKQMQLISSITLRKPVLHIQAILQGIALILCGHGMPSTRAKSLHNASQAELPGQPI